MVLDISDPADPVSLGNCVGAAFGLDVSGFYVYAASNLDGLSIIDVTEPTAPTLVGSYDTPSQAVNVYFYGSHAYVAGSSVGLRVVDLGLPSSPREVSCVDTWNMDEDVFTVDGIAYVAPM